MDYTLISNMFKVQVYESLPPFDEPFPSTSNDARRISALVLEVLRNIADPDNVHLRAPLLALLQPEANIFSTFASQERRATYVRKKHDDLECIAADLRTHLSRTAIRVIIVDTADPKWATFSFESGMEHTVIIEQRLVNVLALWTPEANLFTYTVVYHEITHMVRKWVSPSFE
jgi:hypothetical protein